MEQDPRGSKAVQFGRNFSGRHCKREHNIIIIIITLESLIAELKNILIKVNPLFIHPCISICLFIVHSSIDTYTK